MRSLPLPLLLGAAALVLAACGESAPTLEAAVAEELAGRADVLASRLESDDHCGAIETAGELVAAASGGRDAGTVPDEIAGEVIATARDTVRGLTCEAVPEPPADDTSDEPPPDDHGEDDEKDDEHEKDEDEKDEGGGKGEGKGKGKDDD